MDEQTESEIVIRDFEIEDYDDLLELWNITELPYRPQGRDRKIKIERELIKETSVFLTAKLNRELIGAVFGTHDGRKGWINRLVVSPQYQKRGIGQKLVQSVEKRLSEIGIDILACLIEDYNGSSKEFFHKCGFISHNEISYFAKKKNPNV